MSRGKDEGRRWRNGELESESARDGRGERWRDVARPKLRVWRYNRDVVSNHPSLINAQDSPWLQQWVQPVQDRGARMDKHTHTQTHTSLSLSLSLSLSSLVHTQNTTILLGQTLSINSFVQSKLQHSRSQTTTTTTTTNQQALLCTPSLSPAEVGMGDEQPVAMLHGLHQQAVHPLKLACQVTPSNCIKQLLSFPL